MPSDESDDRQDTEVGHSGDGIEMSEADRKFIEGKRSHPQGDTIAYCPECKKELDDFDLRTDGQGAGRCRSCGTVAWMSFEAQELMMSDCVTLGTFRAAKTDGGSDV